MQELENRLVPSSVSWTGGAGTLNWGDAANWSPVGIPGLGDDVTISVSVSGTINLGAAYAVRSLNDTSAGLGITAGGSLTLAAVVAASTLSKNLTVDPGAALNVGSGASLTVTSNVTLQDNGTVTFSSGDSLNLSSFTGLAQIAVGSGGILTMNACTVSGGNGGAIYVGNGGHFLASNSVFGNGVDHVYFDNGSILNAGDLVGNVFNLSLYLPSGEVQNLSGTGSNNQSFQDINILAGTLSSGQSLALNAIGTASQGSLRYVFLSNFTVSGGASLTVASNVRVALLSNVTLQDNGTVAVGSGATITLFSAYGMAEIAVGNSGILGIVGCTVNNDHGGTIEIMSGGSFQGNSCTLTLSNLTLDNNSADSLGMAIVSGVFSINSGATVSIANNDFSNLGSNGLVAVGDPNATIHLENNYWGTTVPSQIAAKILDHNDDPARPTVLFSPALTSLTTNQPPVLSTLSNQTINEGSTLIFTASANDADGDSITYSLDPGAPAGAAINATTGVFSYTPDDGPATYTIVVRATDNGSPPLSAVQAFTITVNNVAPTASLGGPIDGFHGVQGQVREFTVGATDPSMADQAAGFTYDLHWGDGSADTILSGLTGTHVTHVFAAAGAYTITATATDKDGGRSATVSLGQTINVAEVQNGTLMIGGTSVNDTFDLTPGANTNDVAVTVNGVALGTFTTTGQVQVFGNGGSGDVLNLDDQANPLADQYLITSSTVGRTNAATIAYTGMGTVNVHAGTGANTIAVQSTAAGTPVNVTMGNGANTINVGSATNTLDALLGALTVTGGTGNNTLNLNDQGSSASQTYTIAATTVARSGAAGIVYGKMRKLVVNRSSGANTVAVVNTATSTPVVTSGGPATLIGPNVTSTWIFTGPNSGTVGKVSFSGVSSVVGGSSADTFKFNPAGSLSGAVNGGGGSNKLDYSTFGAGVTVNLQTGTATATAGILNITSVAGSTSTASQLIGPNTANTWSITGVNAGKINTFAFTAMANLTGGLDSDVFKFTNGKFVSGIIDGGGGGDWLDYSAYTTAITVNLTTGAATGANGGVLNIQNVRAGKGGSTLTGDSQGNVLVGGLGSDTITGGSGRSLLIGGLGSDTITAGSDDDIVIGDYTTFDSNNAALMSILAEWQRTDETFSQRVSNLKTGGGLNGSTRLIFGSTVKDDTLADLLTGGAGTDWFFKGGNDTLTDLQSGEQVN